MSMGSWLHKTFFPSRAKDIAMLSRSVRIDELVRQVEKVMAEAQ